MTALGPSHRDHPPYGLRSLWDMLEFNASAFYGAIAIIRRAQGLIDSNKDDADSEFHDDKPVNSASRASIKLRLAELDQQLVILDAKMTMLLSSRISLYTDQSELTWGLLRGLMEELDSRLRDELTLHKVFVLESNKEIYFNPSNKPFGDDVATKFVSAAFEIDEAGKCFAFGRPTACVFHLMRTMEIGIRGVARCINAPDPVKPAERNWGHILRVIKTEMDGRAAGNPGWAMPGDRELFEGAYVSLDAVRVAWRNTTMHVESKYAEEEAEHIYMAVRGFMRRIASRCDENGETEGLGGNPLGCSATLRNTRSKLGLGLSSLQGAHDGTSNVSGQSR